MREQVRFQESHYIVVQGEEEDAQTFKYAHDLELREEQDKAGGSSSGYLEVVTPARSSLVGKSLREVPLRETCNAQVLLSFSGSKVIEEGLAERVNEAGDTPGQVQF